MTEEAAAAAETDTSLTGQEGGSPAPAGSWVDTLPESVREWDEVKNSDSPEKFFEQVSNMRSMIGSSIRIPSEDAGEEARAAFIEKLKTVDGVMMKPQDAEQVQEFLSTLPPEARRAAYENLVNDEGVVEPDLQARMEEAEMAVRDGIERLQKEWGNGFERKVQSAKNAVRLLNEKMGDDRVVNMLDKAGVDSDPDMIALFAEIAGMLGEQPVLDSDGGVNQFAITPAEAKDRIAEIENNPALYDDSNPKEQMRLVEKRNKLAQVAYPDPV